MTDLPGASAALLALAQRGTPYKYRKGRLLISEGEPGDTLHIIVSGRLRVFAGNDDDSRQITYGSYGPGEYVGEMSLDGGPRSANVEAELASTCIVVTRPTLEAFIREQPEFAFELLAKVIARARAATLTARQMALNDVYGRLRLLLLAESEGRPDGTRLLPRRPSHREISQRLGCSREMVSRQLKDLERGGVIRNEGAALVIAKPLPTRW